MEVGCPTTTYDGSFDGVYQTCSGLLDFVPCRRGILCPAKPERQPRARALYRNHLSIHCNDGTVAQTAVSVEVQLTMMLTLLDASPAHGPSGDTYMPFQEISGDLAAAFTITVAVACDVFIGNTACVSASHPAPPTTAPWKPATIRTRAAGQSPTPTTPTTRSPMPGTLPNAG